jgi:hypothetical protein
MTDIDPVSDPLTAMYARWSHIQSYLFPFMREEVGPVSSKLEQIIVILDCMGLEAYVRAPPPGPGRPRDDRRAIARAFVAKATLNLPATRTLVERLAVDTALRRVCGWERRSEIPSEATFSRAFNEFATSDLPGRLHRAVVERAFGKLGERMVGVIATDATEIDAREKPQKKQEDSPPPAPSPPPPAPPRKRGRPKKGQQPAPKPEPSRLERQSTQSLEEMLKDIPTACDVGTKKNAKGYKVSWTGFKLHIAVASGQIPIACILSSASTHDSQVAIPLMTMTSRIVRGLYDVMDAAYDANAIFDYSKSLGREAIIDRNFRGQKELKAKWDEETKARAFINMPDFDDAIYKFRTMVERINGRLKDEFGGRFLRIIGPVKAKCHLMFGMLALTIDQIFRVAKPEKAAT